MFGLGVAVLWWMAALTALMVYEKTGRYGARLVRPAGVVLLAAAALQLAHPTWAPAALGGWRAFAAEASVGPGPARAAVRVDGYALELRLGPNRAFQPGTLSLRLLKRGRPVDGARVRATFAMLDMAMSDVSTQLSRTAPGRYAGAAPPLEMSGRWGLRLLVAPPHAQPVTVRVIDRVSPG
jgi:FixH protein